MADTRMFSGQTAFVTGSSRGIGRVIATHLATLGASVAVHGTTATSAKAFGEADSLEAVATPWRPNPEAGSSPCTVISRTRTSSGIWYSGSGQPWVGSTSWSTARGAILGRGNRRTSGWEAHQE